MICGGHIYAENYSPETAVGRAAKVMYMAACLLKRQPYEKIEDPMKVIIRKYIQSTTETYGYFAGAIFANQIGLTTQMPATLEIVTSKESTKGCTITVGSQAVRLKRPATTITSENAGLLQFLDVVSQAEKYFELSDSDTGIILKNYAKQRNYSKELLCSVLSGITGSAAIKLIEWGIIYEFTS